MNTHRTILTILGIIGVVLLLQAAFLIYMAKTDPSVVTPTERPCSEVNIEPCP